MAEELQSLLEKINNDGIMKAEAEKARIIAVARAEADAIRAAAEKDAASVRAEAEKASAAFYEKSVSALKQAQRDILLQLRSEMQNRLEKAVADSTAQALSPAFMAELIKELCTAFAAEPEKDVSVRCAVKDRDALDNALRGALADSFVKAPVLFGAKGISAGLEISPDGGRCYFDFTADALGDVMNSYIGENLSAVFKAEQ